MIETEAPTVKLGHCLIGNGQTVSATRLHILDKYAILCEPGNPRRVVEAVQMALPQPAKIGFSACVHVAKDVQEYRKAITSTYLLSLVVLCENRKVNIRDLAFLWSKLVMDYT